MRTNYRILYAETYDKLEEMRASRIAGLTALDVLDWLLLQLPESGQWPQADRDNWLSAYTALLDMAVKTVDVAAAEEPTP